MLLPTSYLLSSMGKGSILLFLAASARSALEGGCCREAQVRLDVALRAVFVGRKDSPMARFSSILAPIIFPITDQIAFSSA